MRFIDLSIPVEDGLPSDPPQQIPKIHYMNHKDTAPDVPSYFNNEITVDDLPEGNGWANETIQLSSHSGTHIDAPYHYYPTMNNGERSWTVDELPLEWCIGNGVVMDFSDKPDGYKISAADLEAYFDEKGYTPKKGDIVLLRTGADRFWGTQQYMVAGAGMSAEATLWLLEKGVNVVGTDGWSWDVPLALEAAEFSKTHDTSIIWEAHRVGRVHGYGQIEKLSNLDQVPFTGFTFCCFPVKVKGASAGWCRAVAMVDD